MHKLTIFKHSICFSICIALFSACQDDAEILSPETDMEIREILAVDCLNDCFETGTPFPEKEYQTTVWWGNRKFSKTVDLLISNSADSVFFKLRSSHAAAKIIISISGNIYARLEQNNTLPAETWTVAGFALPEDWQSCDSMEAEIEVIGHGPPAVITVRYHLVGLCNNPLSVTDIDGNIYPVIKFGQQYWMAENLKVTRYRNGDIIPADLNSMEWNYTTEGATAIGDYHYYNDISNSDDVVAVFGRHYNFFAVVDPRGLCPEGWHIPSDEEWDELAGFLIDHYDDVNSGNLGLKMKSTTRWGYFDFEDDYNGTNSFGFNALPAGYIEYPHMISWDMAYYAGWWTSIPQSAGIATNRYIVFSQDMLYKGGSPVQTGHTIRCVKD
jgi:uncharacterized protein (TIGR02145 family)